MSKGGDDITIKIATEGVLTKIVEDSERIYSNFEGINKILTNVKLTGGSEILKLHKEYEKLSATLKNQSKIIEVLKKQLEDYKKTEKEIGDVVVNSTKEYKKETLALADLQS